MRQTFTSFLTLLPQRYCHTLRMLVLTIALLLGRSMAFATTITSFSPASGPAGTLVTVRGSGFVPGNMLYIGGVRAILVSLASTKIVGMVAPGTVTGKVTINGINAATDFIITETPYPINQQGGKIEDVTPAFRPEFLGEREVKAVAVSADGNTAILSVRQGLGGGAVIYARKNGRWAKASPIINTESSGICISVAISADGNTAVMGGMADTPTPVLILRKKNGSWADPLVEHLNNENSATDGRPYVIGSTVSVTADGRTIFIAAGKRYAQPTNVYNGIDAIKIYERHGDVWSPASAPPTPSYRDFGYTRPYGVAPAGIGGTISADGKTAVVIAQALSGSAGGYTAIYRRSTKTSSDWFLQEIFGEYGRVYLNADGSTLIITYDADDANGIHYPGLSRIWQRVGTVWNLWQTLDIDGEATMSADGNTLLFSRTGAVYTRKARGLFKKRLDLKPDFEGVSAAISADGATAFIGKAKDNTFLVGSTPAYTGAFYAFSITPPPAIAGTFAPASGPVGTLLSIKGTGISAATSVTVGGVKAIIVSKNNTETVVMVMPGAVTGEITINLPTGIVSLNGNFTVTATPYPIAQQGGKMADTEPSLSPAYLNPTSEVKALALSADGNTAIVAVRNTVGGGAVIYTRTGGEWLQACPVIPYESSGGIGTSVAISADGSTAVMGGVTSGGASAKPVPVLVLKQVNGSWSTPLVQHLKNSANQSGSQPYTVGNTVSITADGNTIVVAAGVWNRPPESGYNGIDTVKIYNREGDGWLQAPTPTAPAGYGRAGMFGTISADGKTLAVIGQAYNADRSQGYTAVYHRQAATGNDWALQFVTVEFSRTYLSANGNTLITTYDSQDIDGVHYPGLTRVWERTGSTWELWQTREIEGEATISADGNTLLLSRVGQVYTRKTRGQFVQKLDLAPQFNGVSAALSADGTTALIGRPGFGSPGNIGAFYAFSSAQTQALPVPTHASASLGFFATTSKTSFVFWQNGTGASRAVFIKAGTTGAPEPVDGALYTASNPYTQGSPINTSNGNTGWYCVYTGPESAVTLTGLSPSTTYRVAVVDYNGGVGPVPTTYVKSFPIENFTTLPPSATPIGVPSYLGFSNTTATTSTLNWTHADGEKSVVFVRADQRVGYQIDDFITLTANTTFGLGSTLPRVSGWYCVYNGTGSTVDISGLQPSTYYAAMVFEYNGSSGQERYARQAIQVGVTTAAAPTTLLSINQKRMLVEQDVLEEANVEVNVHQALSPNGDGVNDIFTIDGIGSYPENTVKVINSSGDVIYSTTGYNNYSKAFNGHATNGTLQQAGTYFYSLEYKKGKETIRKTGYLVIKY